MGEVTLDKLYDNYNVLSDAKNNFAEVKYTDCLLESSNI